MNEAEWIWAALVLGCGLLIGEIAGRLVRRAFERREQDGPSRTAARRELASIVGSVVFWTMTAVGLVIAIGIVDVDVLEDLRSQLGESVPRLGVAALLLIGGHAVSVLVAAMVGQSARKATGVRQRGVELALQLGIMGAAVVIALAELGVQPGLIVAPLVALIGAPALAFALLSGLGGREVAGQLAAGRALRHQLREGRVLQCGDVRGRIVAMHPTTVEVECGDGSRTHIPNRRMLTESFSISE